MGTSTAGKDSGKTVTESFRFSDEMLAAISDMSSAVGMLQDLDGVVDRIADYGTGFEVCNDKASLVGVPFLVIQWGFSEGSYGAEKVVAHIVTNKGDKLVIVGGGSGIYDQLRGVTETREANKVPNTTAGLACPGGLRVSDYFVNADGTDIVKFATPGYTPAHTYYLS